MSHQNVFLKVIDHSVSNEEFSLVYNREYDLLKTIPQPNKEAILEYYKSDDYISHTNTKRTVFEKTYHLIRSITLKRKLKLINSFNLEDKKLLDVGCGTGIFLKKAKGNGWKVNGVEPNVSARNIAEKIADAQIFETNEQIEDREDCFDCITLWHVLEHVHDLNKQISVLKKMLKKNGRLVVAVPNYKSFDASFYKSYWAAFDVPRHLWHFSQKSISKLFEEHDMVIDKIYPMKFDAYYVSLLSEKNKSGWMNIFNAFFIASRSNLKAGRSGEYSSLTYVIKNQ